MEPHSNAYLEEQATHGIKQNVMKAAGARGDKALVKLVEASGGEGGKQSQSCPEDAPSPGRGKSGAPGEEGKRTEQPIAEKMRRLADQEMNLHEPVVRNIPKERMQDLLKNAAGVFGGKHVNGKKRQHAEPDERRNPCQ